MKEFDIESQQWVSTSKEWEDCFEDLLPNKKVLVDRKYSYILTSLGISIIDIYSNSVYRDITKYNTYTSIAQNSSRLYIGTYNNGIKYLDKSDLLGPILSYDINLTSNSIRSISCTDNYLCCTTISGVDMFSLNGEGHIHTNISGGAELCHQTEEGKFYYTTNNKKELHRIDNYTQNWTIPDYTYNIIAHDIIINDMCAGNNKVFLATTSGIIICDEYSIEKNYLHSGYILYVPPEGDSVLLEFKDPGYTSFSGSNVLLNFGG